MSALRVPILSLLAVMTVAAPAARPLPGAPDLPRAFLRDQMGFSARDLSALEAGRPVARQMATREAVDVNIFGAVRIEAPAEAFVRQLREIEAFERKLGILQAGRFQNPPQLADLNGLTLEPKDIHDLQRCRPGHCELQLPADDIERFRREVDWRGGDVSGQANRLFRRILFDRLQAYQARGLAPLTYHDRGTPISAAADFRLLSAPGDLPIALPGLVQYLSAYPAAPLPGATDVFYWNKGEFGMKPTIRLNHLVVYPLNGAAAASGHRYVVATSQIYADHYFSATLELRTLVEDPSRPGGFYLFYTTKSRVSGLTGFMGLLIRSTVRSRARSGMERYLAVTKRTLESR